MKLPEDYWKVLYPICLVGSTLLLIFVNNRNLESMYFLTKISFITEILFFLILVSLKFIKTINPNFDRLEEIVFLIPLVAYLDKYSSIFMAIYFIYKVGEKISRKVCGQLSIETGLVSILFILNLIKLDENIIEFSFIYTALLAMLSIIRKSKTNTILSLKVLIIYSINFLDVNVRVYIGVLLLSIFFLSAVLENEIETRFEEIKKKKFINYLYLALITYFEKSEKNVQIFVMKTDELKIFNERKEEKVFYNNTIRTSQAMAFFCVILIFILSLYFVRDFI